MHLKYYKGQEYYKLIFNKTGYNKHHSICLLIQFMSRSPSRASFPLPGITAAVRTRRYGRGYPISWGLTWISGNFALDFSKERTLAPSFERRNIGSRTGRLRRPFPHRRYSCVTSRLVILELVRAAAQVPLALYYTLMKNGNNHQFNRYYGALNDMLVCRMKAMLRGADLSGAGTTEFRCGSAGIRVGLPGR